MTSPHGHSAPLSFLPPVLLLAAIAVVGGRVSPRPGGSPPGGAARAALLAAPPAAAQADSLWAPIRRVFGQKGEVKEGYFRINLPRSDLHVRIGRDALSPDFEFTSYVGFAPAPGGVLAMGEVVLRAEEAGSVLAEARRLGVTVTALHNHLVGEEPRILYMHVLEKGAPATVATRLKAVFARTGTPLTGGEKERPSAHWNAIDQVLGQHAEAEGKVAEYEFPRKEGHEVHGVAVKSSGQLETASEAVFQDLGGGRVANTGELYVLPTEVEGVLSALEEHGLHVTAVHNHMIDERPVMYWIHWYATGDGPTVARGVKAALARTNSEQASHGE